MNIFREVKYLTGESHALDGIGSVYLKESEIMKAIIYHNKALEIRKNLNNSYLIAESYKNIAKDYIQDRNYKVAELIIKKGIIISKEIQSQKLLKAFYYQLFELSKKTRNYEKALVNYLNYSEIKDSLLSFESENKIAELEIQYQSEKKEQKIELLSVKNKLNTEIIHSQKNNLMFLVAGLGILLVSLVIVLFIYFQRDKAYKMLVKHNIEIANLEESQKQKVPKQKISNEQQIINDLLSIIEENNYFLNPSCTIDELAKKISTNRQYLSKIVNDRFQSNFNNFINTYRVKEARKLLLDNEYNKYTIDAIAKLSGFNNKATFNTAFKKNTGVTPSFFKKEQSLYTS